MTMKNEVLNIDINDIKFVVKVLETPKLKAIIAIDLGSIKIKGFRVNFSNYKNDNHGEALWVIPPSYQDSGGKYHPIFYMPDKELWHAIEKRLVEAYKKEYEKHFKKRFDLKDEEINNIKF